MFLIQSMHFDFGLRTNNPAKTLAVFAHNEDFSYSSLPNLIQVLNSCQTLQNLL